MFVLQSLCQACPSGREVLILYEVALSVQRLLSDPQLKLSSREWDLVVDVLVQSYTNIGTPDQTCYSYYMVIFFFLKCKIALLFMKVMTLFILFRESGAMPAEG